LFLSVDGLALIGNRTELLHNDPDSWEGPLVEGPWVIHAKEYYYLFYSANGYASDKYAVGVARSKSILGPYKKFEGNPILKSDTYWSGPGHCSVVRVANSTNPGSYFMMYHSWIGKEINTPYPRVLMMDAIEWTSDQWPIIKNKTPSRGAQPVPN
jgi:beta-xylosidase